MAFVFFFSIQYLDDPADGDGTGTNGGGGGGGGGDDDDDTNDVFPDVELDFGGGFSS